MLNKKAAESKRRLSDDEALQELRKITKILLMANSKVVADELGRLASTDDRKRMWVLMDGNRSPKQIADYIKAGERGVQKFVTAGAEADLIDAQRGSPRRKLDYVPPAWVELLPEEDEAKAGNEEQAKK
jgi:hypothetical protein